MQVRGGSQKLSFLLSRFNNQIQADHRLGADEEFLMPDDTIISLEAESVIDAIEIEVKILESSSPL